MKEDLAGLVTEMVNEETKNIDRCSTLEMVEQINRQDAQVAGAVAAEKERIAQAVDLISGCLGRGGRLIYLGAGTSGRLGVLDASECPPTFGVEPELVQGHIAGGDIALRVPVEGCEDDEEEGIRLVKKTAAHCLKIGKPWLIFSLVFFSGCKYIGYRLGKNYRKLPKWLIQRCTMNRGYWKQQ